MMNEEIDVKDDRITELEKSLEKEEEEKNELLIQHKLQLDQLRYLFKSSIRITTHSCYFELIIPVNLNSPIFFEKLNLFFKLIKSYLY